jgi:hypothetical protein
MLVSREGFEPSRRKASASEANVSTEVSPSGHIVPTAGVEPAQLVTDKLRLILARHMPGRAFKLVAQVGIEPTDHQFLKLTAFPKLRTEP